MSLAFKPEHLKRYRDIAQIMMKYGHSSMTAEAGLDPILTEEDRVPVSEAKDPKAEELADDLKKWVRSTSSSDKFFPLAAICCPLPT